MALVDLSIAFRWGQGMYAVYGMKCVLLVDTKLEGARRP